ncbi:hypothetical protein [Streptococcus sinensis]|uniref:SnoaL-like domain-containing protein n=1 Tax=Streptococcus sinensis TaxID=176090 RepID=A0A0A0DFQ1_9STRE|nr:hypothetical protein [Streptococcus sinensis]KGM36899.1 hypothetical protein SSIN_1414 [Streptococcus sinensis]MCD1276867.1 hypothetical protein [Streptococcus sinensis]
MTNLEKLFAFFEAENQRDWDIYQTFLDEHVVWELHGDSPEIIQRKELYLHRIKEAYQDSSAQFSCQHYHTNSDQSRILTILLNDCGDLSCDIFEFANGLIVKEIEYLLKKRVGQKSVIR